MMNLEQYIIVANSLLYLFEYSTHFFHVKYNPQILSAHYSMHQEAEEFDVKMGVRTIPECALHSIK